jgi:hypothetical protein
MNERQTVRHAIVRLIAGPLYSSDTDLWRILRTESATVIDHFSRIGLEVIVDEEAGYAFLRQADDTDEVADGEDGEAPLPRLLRRTPLSYHQTMLMILLRERLLQHDQSADGEEYLHFDYAQLLDLQRPYFPDVSNEKKIEDRMGRTISRLVELGVLRKLKNRSDDIYRVEPILRAKLPVEQIREIRDRLRAHLGEEREEAPEDNENEDEEIRRAESTDA